MSFTFYIDQILEPYVHQSIHAYYSRVTTELSRRVADEHWHWHMYTVSEQDRKG